MNVITERITVLAWWVIWREIWTEWMACAMIPVCWWMMESIAHCGFYNHCMHFNDLEMFVGMNASARRYLISQLEMLLCFFCNTGHRWNLLSYIFLRSRRDSISGGKTSLYLSPHILSSSPLSSHLSISSHALLSVISILDSSARYAYPQFTLTHICSLKCFMQSMS